MAVVDPAEPPVSAPVSAVGAVAAVVDAWPAVGVG